MEQTIRTFAFYYCKKGEAPSPKEASETAARDVENKTGQQCNIPSTAMELDSNLEIGMASDPLSLPVPHISQ